MTATIALDEDQLPVWTYAEGTAIDSGLRAWQRLGVGHRCETWLAWSDELWSPVVVKLARPHQTEHPRAIRSLGREVAALTGQYHPSLPRLIAVGTRRPTPYVVLEYVDGLALDDLLADRRGLDDDSVALLGAQLLAALVPVHRRGIAHVDIKPENVMVRDGRPVLTDFGSARRIGSRQPPGRPVGTLGWAAPEMEKCRPISAAMDVFGVGKVLEACLDPGSEHPVGSNGRRLRGLIADLIADDPEARPSLAQALARVADATSARQRPWPSWV